MDVEDLAAHTAFAGGYHQDHPIIHNLWEVRTLCYVMSNLAAADPRLQVHVEFLVACMRSHLVGQADLIGCSRTVAGKGRVINNPCACLCRRCGRSRRRTSARFCAL